MKRLLRWLLHPWLWLALTVAALSVAVWFIGPLVKIGDVLPLESEASRWIAIGVMVAWAVLRIAGSAWRARRTNASVVAQLVAVPTGERPGPADAEIAVLHKRFGEALSQLRTARFATVAKGAGGAWSQWSSRVGSRYLYELPWYVIIGAPGSGKTTALLNSGLQFPLSSTVGEHAVRGVGGTRHCDWWFTDEAVLIDTAGRYTTQASDAEVDARAWQGFLGLLKRSRPRQPISGVLVTVSVPDLLMQAAPERAAHALAIRRRVQELHEHLGIRFPIYLLVTKCDLLSGFTDYLGDIDKAQRATPWGFTFALDRDMRSDLTSYRAEFEALEQRLHDGLIARLQSEREPQRRARIYAFPQQFAGMRDVLHGFLEQVFSPSAYEQHPMLRGVYFVSGTQEGTPIDRMLGRIARSFDLAADPAVAAIPGQGKSYFLTRLLRELVFAEGGLAGTNLRWERRRGAMAGLGYLAIALVLCLAVAAWSLSYVNNQRYLDQVAQGLDRAEQLAATTPPVSADPRPLLPRLQAALDLPRPPASAEGPARLLLGFGLYQGDKLAAASRQAYQELLERGLLGSIAARIDQRLRSGGTDEQRYEALKAYLMLRDPEHLDWQALRQQVLADWGATLPRDTTAEQLGALASHLEALVALGPSTAGLAVDQELVADTQQRLRGTAMAARLYQRLRQQGVGPGIAAFSPERAGGAQTTLVFRRASGAPMSQAIPALYTAEGYHQGFQQQVSGVAGQLIDEQTWVLGMPAVPSSDTARKALADQARRLYLSDYAKVWEALLADLKLVQPRSLVDAIQTARILSASDTPLVPLLRDISRQTTLARPAEGVVAKAESLVGSLAEQSRRALDNAFRAAGRGGSTAESSVAIEEQLVDSRFAALRQHVSAPGGQGPAPIDATVTLLSEVYSFFSTADTAIRAGNTPPQSPVPDRVKAEGARAPEPIRSMLTGLTVTGGSMASGATRVNLGREVDAQIGEFCRSAVNGRYPFARGSDRDVTQEDFAQLFAPNGKFDEFFQQRLQPFVDTSRRPWRFREASGTSMGGPGALSTFQRAAAIREAFFRGAGNAPALRLEFRPDTMDPSIKQFILDVDGQVVRYAHGPALPVTITWPGSRGGGQVRVEVSPPSLNGRSGMVTNGPWALFRLFDRMQIEQGPVPERFRVIFDVDGRKASFEVTTSSVRNPFRMAELQDFSCPSGL